MPSWLSRPQWLEPAAPVVIIALAIVLRFWGIGFGFPEHVRPDEQYFVGAVQRFDRQATLDPDWFYYPSLYMYINLAVWRGYVLWQLVRGNYTVPNPALGQPPYFGLEQLRARSPDIDYLLGRCVTAAFGVATVVLVYFFARRFFGRKAAVAAGLLLAVNSLHTLNSHFYKSDVATTFFTVAALACMARYVQARQTRWNVGAAIGTGLATATNYYGGFLAVPLAASQFMARYENQKSVLDAARATGRAILEGLICWQTYAMAALALAVFVAASPYCFIRWTDFLSAFHRMLFADRQTLYDTMVRVVGFRDFGFQGSPLLYSVRFCYVYSMGFALAVVAACGLIYLAVRGRATGWLLLMFFAVHFFMTASGKAIFMRYYLSLIPVLTIAAGALLSSAAQKQARKKVGRQNVLLAVALFICGAECFSTSKQQDRLLVQKDTRVEAREWLAKNLPPNTIVGTPVDWWGNYYPYGKPTLPAKCFYVPVRPDEVRDRGIRYVLVDSSHLRLYSPLERPEWTFWLSKNAKLIYEVTPNRMPTEKSFLLYDQLDAFYVPVDGFTNLAIPGPQIRVYQVLP